MIIDIYFTDIMQVFREAHKIQSNCGGRFVILSDAVRGSCDGMTFVRRGEQLETMKNIYLGCIGGSDDIPLLNNPLKVELGTNIILLEAFVLKAWLRGQTLTDIARLNNRSIKTISPHKRNAMKKLMVSSNAELYWKLSNE